MQWFYHLDGESVGPVTREELDALAVSGRVNLDTPVWTEGMTSWDRYRSIAKALPVARVPDEPLIPAKPDDAPAQPLVICSQCGRGVSADQTLLFRSVLVCAACKPMFLHRLKEAAVPPGTLQLASFGSRAVARIVDQLILSVINGIVMFPMIFGMVSLDEGSGAGAATLGVFFVLYAYLGQFAVAMGYEIGCLGRWGATPGKLMMRLRVVRADGSKLSWGRATGRGFSLLVSHMTFFIGYLLAAFDSNRRALHDMIADTRVVRPW